MRIGHFITSSCPEGSCDLLYISTMNKSYSHGINVKKQWRKSCHLIVSFELRVFNMTAIFYWKRIGNSNLEEGHSMTNQNLSLLLYYSDFYIWEIINYANVIKWYKNDTNMIKEMTQKTMPEIMSWRYIPTERINVKLHKINGSRYFSLLV